MNYVKFATKPHVTAKNLKYGRYAAANTQMAVNEPTTWNLILKLIRDPFAASILSALVIGIGTLIAKIILQRDIENWTIKVNQADELAKFEIQRTQQLAEIRTKHLLQIYSKLHDAAHGVARPFVTYFTTIGFIR